MHRCVTRGVVPVLAAASLAAIAACGGGPPAYCEDLEEILTSVETLTGELELSQVRDDATALGLANESVAAQYAATAAINKLSVGADSASYRITLRIAYERFAEECGD